jgi:hypothetical protein
VRVDVVGSALRVVFEDEDRRFLPVRVVEIASTRRPSAKSLSATIARGVGVPGWVPLV